MISGINYSCLIGRGRVSRINFTKFVVEIYHLRKQLVHLVASQQNIRRIVTRMISIFLGFVFLLIFLLMIGVPADALIISGVALLSSVTVILSKSTSYKFYHDIRH